MDFLLFVIDMATCLTLPLLWCRELTMRFLMVTLVFFVFVFFCRMSEKNNVSFVFFHRRGHGSHNKFCHQWYSRQVCCAPAVLKKDAFQGTMLYCFFCRNARRRVCCSDASMRDQKDLKKK